MKRTMSSFAGNYSWPDACRCGRGPSVRLQMQGFSQVERWLTRSKSELGLDRPQMEVATPSPSYIQGACTFGAS